MTKSFPCTLLFLLCAYIGQGQILGAEISPGGENQDTVIFTASIYYECIDLPKINDTLLVQTVDPVLDTIAKIFAPRRTEVDTITYDCARCICNRDECGRPYIIKQTFYYEFSKGANGLFGRCRLRASFMPGKRVDSLSFMKAAQSTEIRVEAEINTCKNTGVSDYYFALPPEFHAIKDEYYISSPGLGLQMSNRSRYHLFTAELVNPIDDHRDTLQYETNYSAEDPLYYNGFPNTNNNFPRGFHLNNETGDLRFTPTKRGHSLIKTRYYIDGDSVGLGFAEREFALHVIVAKPESPPLLSGRDFSSFLNRDNYRLSFCANSGKSIGFKISDINSGSYLFPRVTIPPYLQPYLKYSYSNDTLIFTGDLDSFLTEGREHRVFVQIYDSSCAIGSSSSYTLRLSNSKTPKAIPRFDYLGKRRIQMETVPVDSFWALSYTWRMNGQSFNKKDTNLQLNVPGDYKYVHISYGEYGCNDTVRGTYTSPAFPYIKLKANTTIFCEGTELELEPDYLNTSETPAALWNGQINALIFKTTVTGDSMYTAQVTFSDSSVSIDTFVVEYLPAPPSAIVSKGQHCKGNKMLLKAVQDSSAKDSSDQTIWFFNDQLVGSNETVTIEGEGLLRLEVPYPNGCVAKTLQDIEYTKRSALFQKTYSTCANETLPIDLDNDPNAAYTWLIKDSVWLENSPSFVLERPVVNQPLIVKSTYDNDTISCIFEDTVSIEIKAHLTFSVLTDSFFCANDSFVYLLDSSFIQPNDGIWIDSNSRSPIYDTFFLDPSKGKQGQVLEKLYYQTEHPTTGCTYTRPVGLGVHNLPKPWVADSIKLCIGGPTILLNDGRYSNPTSGTWSGTGVIEIDSLQYFSPTLVGINSVNTIQYEIANEAGCVVKQPSIVTVNLKPDPVGLRRFAAAPGSIAFIDNRDDADSCIVDWWFWDFHDPFAPKCTTAVDDASFDGTKCRYSRREKPVHYYTVSGTYDVTLVVKNTQTNIQDQITKEDHVNLLGSGFEENWVGKMAIYPNPNDGGFTIASTEIVGASRYLIFNPLGKIVQEGNITSIEQKIDLRTSTSGMHWVAVYNHDGARIGFQSVLIK